MVRLGSKYYKCAGRISDGCNPTRANLDCVKKNCNQLMYYDCTTCKQRLACLVGDFLPLECDGLNDFFGSGWKYVQS